MVTQIDIRISVQVSPLSEFIYKDKKLLEAWRAGYMDRKLYNDQQHLKEFDLHPIKRRPHPIPIAYRQGWQDACHNSEVNIQFLLDGKPIGEPIQGH